MPKKIQGNAKKLPRMLQRILRQSKQQHIHVPESKDEKVFYGGAWRSKEAVERKRKQQRESRRERWHSDPEYREQQLAKAKRKRLANPKAERERSQRWYANNKERDNERRKRWSEANRERQRENNRNSYNQKRAERLSNIYQGRDRRDPSRVIRRLGKDLREGRIGLNDFITKIREQVDGSYGRMREQIGSGAIKRRRHKG